MCHVLLLVTCSRSEGNLESTTFSAFVAEAAQSKGKLRKLRRNPLKGRKWQKPPKAKENLENCRENWAMCHLFVCSDTVVTCSNSAGNLGNGRKKLGLVPLAQWNHKSEAVRQWEKHGNSNFFSSCLRWSAPTQSKNKKMAKKAIERMETATFSAVWQKPSKAKEKIEICRENKPCAICVY